MVKMTSPPPFAAFPRHVAIIMDGNARWARARMRPVVFGHRQGAEALRGILKPAAELGIQCLSVYAFSQENWNRPADEVSELMGLLDRYLTHEVPELIKNDIRLHISGDTTRLHAKTQHAIASALKATETGTAITLNICLNYGSRQEITRACQTIAERCARGEISPDTIQEQDIVAALYTAPLPELDLLIRTGGDFRISNFLLWQSAYTELFFTDILWPDFDAAALNAACETFAARERRYGGR
jgi:undecaprenyl diphosphate synthase